MIVSGELVLDSKILCSNFSTRVEDRIHVKLRLWNGNHASVPMPNTETQH